MVLTNLSRPAERIVAFYNLCGTCEQWIKEGKGAIKWPLLSCRSFAANAVRLQLHAFAYGLGNPMCTLAMPKVAEPSSLTTLREKLIKIGAEIVSHGRYVAFQLAEVAVSRQMFQEILILIARLRVPPVPVRGAGITIRRPTTGEVWLDEGKATSPVPRSGQSSLSLPRASIMGRRLLLPRPKSEAMVVNGTGTRGMSAKEA